MKQSIAKFADASITSLDTVLGGGGKCKKSSKSKSSKSNKCKSSKSKKSKSKKSKKCK